MVLLRVSIGLVDRKRVDARTGVEGWSLSYTAGPFPFSFARMSRPVRVLTGITTTGTPHLGNYVGAIRPAIAASREPGVESFFFMADYHALIKCEEPARIERSRLEIAATWLAAGLDPERVVFYRQSDIPEIPELTWLLTCVTAKGLMNRAHAYKAAVDANTERGEDADAAVTMGLYSYPILMAADILMFNAQRVPVGRDQVQHIEMARDIGQRFNHLFGGGREFFVLPEAVVDESVATLPGLDGRKMSKSYDNTVPLFEGGAKRLREAILKIVTDSRLPGEPKAPEGTSLLTLFQAFASAQESEAFAQALREGLGWGEAKERLFAQIDAVLAPMRTRYEALMAEPERIEAILQQGAAKARAVARPLLDELRAAVGLRPFRAVTRLEAQGRVGVSATKPTLAVFKQYREADGRFYFKLLDGEGALLLQSEGFESPREAGQRIAALKRGELDASLGEGADADAIRSALLTLRQAEAEKGAG
jgi:tryptophanyl-tRNA synthetase